MNQKKKQEKKVSDFALVVRNDLTIKKFTSIMSSLSAPLLKVLKDGTSITLSSLPPEIIFNPSVWIVTRKKLKQI